MTRVISLQKLLVLLAVGALVLALAVPAMAIGGLVEQDTKQDGESGMFTASTVGVLVARSVFTIINLATGDSIQFTWEIKPTP